MEDREDMENEDRIQPFYEFFDAYYGAKGALEDALNERLKSLVLAKKLSLEEIIDSEVFDGPSAPKDLDEAMKKIDSEIEDIKEEFRSYDLYMYEWLEELVNS